METITRELERAKVSGAAERLDALADLIEREPLRWTRGSFYVDADGEPTDDRRSACRACLVGMARIAWESDLFVEEGVPANILKQAFFGRDEKASLGGVVSINDGPDMTSETAVRVLRHAANIARRELAG